MNARALWRIQPDEELIECAICRELLRIGAEHECGTGFDEDHEPRDFDPNEQSYPSRA